MATQVSCESVEQIGFVIGNSDYKYEPKHASYKRSLSCAADGVAIANAWRKRGIAIPDEHVVINGDYKSMCKMFGFSRYHPQEDRCFDEQCFFDHRSNNSCTIGEKVSQVLAQQDPTKTTVFMFYYGGLATMMKNEMWLVPTNGIINSECEREEIWINLNLLFTRLDNIAQGKNVAFVFMLDCHDFVDVYGRRLCADAKIILPELPSSNFIVSYAHAGGLAKCNVESLGRGAYALAIEHVMDTCPQLGIISMLINAHNQTVVLGTETTTKDLDSMKQLDHTRDNNKLVTFIVKPWFMSSVRQELYLK